MPKEEQEQGTKATIGDLREQQVSYTLDGLVTQLIVTGRNRRATSVTETPKVSVDSTAMGEMLSISQLTTRDATGEDTTETDPYAYGSGTTENKQKDPTVANLARMSQLTDRYVELGQLGAGGMGRVLRVKDLLLNRVLAMKVVHDHLLNDEANVHRFIHEAQVGAQLQHPNILPIHDLGVLSSGQAYMTTTEIKGQSLHEHIVRVHAKSSEQGWEDTDDGWNLNRLISAFHDVCKAIAYSHQRGVVHRDLKPRNIMVGPFGEVLVVDWGLAKIISDDDPEASIETVRSDQPVYQTAVGSVNGTPAYLAPELVTNVDATANPLTDLYALGVTLYEILRGTPAYRGNHVYKILMQIASDTQPGFDPPASKTAEPLPFADDIPTDPVSHSGASIPKDLVEICNKAIAREPNERFASVT